MYYKYAIRVLITLLLVVKVKGCKPETLTTGLLVLSMPGMATWPTYNPSLIEFEPLVDPENPNFYHSQEGGGCGPQLVAPISLQTLYTL